MISNPSLTNGWMPWLLRGGAGLAPSETEAKYYHDQSFLYSGEEEIIDRLPV
jgi:hypothetical protein